MSEQRRISIQLTEDQRAAIKQATGKDADKLELSVEELEERIAPMKVIHTKLGPYA